MAEKDEALWVMAGNYGYYLYVGRKPVRSKRGNCPKGRKHEYACKGRFQWLVPKRLLPKLGGPAVRLEFV